MGRPLHAAQFMRLLVNCGAGVFRLEVIGVDDGVVKKGYLLCLWLLQDRRWQGCSGGEDAGDGVVALVVAGGDGRS